MRRKARIIQISGFRGILTVVFIASCLAAGFIAFPALAAMYIWNFAAHHVAIPVINFYQGLLLWAIVAITVFIINDRQKCLVSYSAQNGLSDDEIIKLLERIHGQQVQVFRPMVLKPGDLKPIEKNNSQENKEKENV